MERVPNILSTLRIVLTPVFVVLYLQPGFLWSLLGMVVFVIAAITDYLDGYFARRYKVSTSLGKFLDPLADKILTLAGFLCIPFIDPHQFPWWIIAVIVLRDGIVTLLRLVADRYGQMMETRTMAKVKTMVQMVFLYVVLFLGVMVKAGGPIAELSALFLASGIAGWVFVLVMLITVYTAVEYIYMNWRLITGDPSRI